jgi:predicted outer membrane repeat protein
MNRKTNLKNRVVILLLVAGITGAVWNVSTVYGQAQPDYPFDGDIIIGEIVTYLGKEHIWTKLIFIPDANAVKHTGYFSVDYNDVAGRVQDANLGAPPYGKIPGWEYTLFAGNPQVFPAVDSLVRGTKYYWTVDETEALGNTLAGDVWEFTILGFKASSPNPPNESIFVETDVVLSWLPGFGVEEHDVYLGTDFNNVNNALSGPWDPDPPPEYQGTTTEASLLVTGLIQGVKYYWRVDEVNHRMPPPIGGGEYYTGDVWCFTTIPEGLGSIREDLWWGIAGDAVSDLLNDPRYPGNPDEIRMLSSFDSGVGLGEDYGGQIHGWLHPAKSGDYTFWLCSDDSSELFLSTDHTPANKMRIAYIDGWAGGPYDWYNQGGTNNPYQQSAPISLVGSEKYYIMARWKEDFAGDYCMAAWQGPDQPQAPIHGSSSAVIPGSRLSPFVQLWAHDPDPCDGQVSVESPVTLRWDPGDNADKHDVYVGTDKALVESRASSVYAGRIDSNSYNLDHVFSGMIYYWAIDEVTDFGPEPGIWQGEVWSFTTMPAPIFVDVDATGANDGSNWANAFNSLQDGLTRANSSVKPVEIRVAQGIYKPTKYAPPPPGAPPSPVARAATFQLINNVTVKGGYAGFGEADPNARDIDTYETILSGDLNGNDVEVSDPCDLLDEPTRAENSYHVVTGSGTDDTSVLDGFTITAGNANGSYLSNNDKGGGMYNYEGDPILTNCTFSNNSVFSDNWESGGGAMYNSRSNPTITNCIFSENLSNIGGGICNWESSNPTLTNCTFNENSAKVSGGGIYNHWLCDAILTNCTFVNNLSEIVGGGMSNDSYSDSKVINCIFIGNSANIGGGMFIQCFSGSIVTNCTFTGNSAGLKGGGIYSGYSCPPPGPPKTSPVITNCILYGNTPDELDVGNQWAPVVAYSDVRYSWPGEGNIDADPWFALPGNWNANGMWVEGDYHLLAGSPCIDAGDPNYVPEPNEMDLDGNPRVIGGRIDMGAYEFFNTQPVGDAGDDQVVECACNTAEGTKVTLDGSSSYDEDGDALTYSWTGPFVESPTDGATPTVTLEDGCPGDYVITLVVNDGTEDSEPNEVVITVVDTTPPEFTFSVSPTMLWPPNKKMVKITPSWTLSDDCDATPDVSLVSVSMNESETRRNGHTGDDIQIGDDGTIYVRAKRSRTGDRIYTITYQAVDDSGNATVGSATVTVPRKKR